MNRMINKSMKIITSFAIFVLLCGAGIYANELKVAVDLNQSILVAEEKQTAYLRIGITGFQFKESEKRTPVNLAIVLDKSGSMQGEKIQKAKNAAKTAISKLDSRDILSVVAYDSNVYIVVPATKVSDTQSIYEKIDQIYADNSTALFGGVCKGSAEVKKFFNENYINRIILLSDGLANVGPSSVGELSDLGASLSKEGISVTTIGLGSDYNEDLMTQLARSSDGTNYFAESADALEGVFNKEFSRALSVAAKDIKVKIRCEPWIRPVRVLGRDAEIKDREVSVFIKDIYSEKEKQILLEIEINPEKAQKEKSVAKCSIEYFNLGKKSNDSITKGLKADISSSRTDAEKSIKGDVQVFVVKYLATEKNELAMKLRDQGKVEEAKQMLYSNKAYLLQNATIYNSQQLDDYAVQNSYDADNLDQDKYIKNRKQMQMQQQWNYKE